MNKFEKVSFEQFYSDACGIGIVSDNGLTYVDCQLALDDLSVPKRGTVGSAGYDFYAPFDFDIKKDEYITIPLGIRWVTDINNLCLLIVPRSGLGFKCGTRLANTVGVIDSDYCQSNNEGHILLKIRADKDVHIEKGKAIVQGIITTYVTVDNDNCKEYRNGGFGSTDKKIKR